MLGEGRVRNGDHGAKGGPDTVERSVRGGRCLLLSASWGYVDGLRTVE